MPDTSTTLLWFAAVVSACLGLLVSNAPAPPKELPNFFSIPWWQDITIHYNLSSSGQVAPAYPADDCVSVAIRGSGFHQHAFYEITCLPSLLLGAGSDSGQVTILQALPPEFFVDPYELEQDASAKSGDVQTVLFGRLDLEQPAPACHATVLGVTLRNVTRKPHKRGGRSVYQSVELPIHIKYPAPLDGGTGCDSWWQLVSGPTRLAQLPPPLLLLQAGSPGRSGDAETGDHAADGPDSRADSGLGLDDDRLLGPQSQKDPQQQQQQQEQQQQQQQQEQQQQEQQQEQRKPGVAGQQRQQKPRQGQWSVMRVQLSQDAAVSVAVPAGCRAHSGLVSGVTLLTAVLCSAAMVATALL